MPHKFVVANLLCMSVRLSLRPFVRLSVFLMDVVILVFFYLATEKRVKYLERLELSLASSGVQASQVNKMIYRLCY